MHARRVREPGALAILLAFLLLPAQLKSQTPVESLLIGPGDLLAVHVFREPDLDTTVRVRDAGTVVLPLIGAVGVAGQSAADAAEKIAACYRRDAFLTRPQVTIAIEESAAQQVAVLGEVARPGTVKLSAARSLLDVLAEAGGLLRTADRHVTIRRATGQSETVMVASDSASQLRQAAVSVAPGDTVLVPRAGIVYVLGDVGRPGGYLMQDDARLSVLQALSMAAGISKTAAEGSARLLRRRGDRTDEIPLHLKALESGKLPDLSLENNDIVYIPFSFTKNLAMGASTVAASASSAIIYATY